MATIQSQNKNVFTINFCLLVLKKISTSLLFKKQDLPFSETFHGHTLEQVFMSSSETTTTITLCLSHKQVEVGRLNTQLAWLKEF